jgi:translation initiation factor IF-3
MQDEKQTRINSDIKAKTVLLINEDGNNVGSVNFFKALSMAVDAGLDLVEVSAGKDIPICRIMDYGRWRYEQSKRIKKNKSQGKSQGSKEIKFRPNTGPNDLLYRAKQLDAFIEDGYKVKLCIRFKGREIEHMYDTGKDLLERFLNLIAVKYKMIGTAVAEGNNISQWIGPENE